MFDGLIARLKFVTRAGTVLDRMGGDLFGDPSDPATPQPLLFVPLVIDTKLVRALLDSGASDSFVSQDVVNTMMFQTHPLHQKLTVRVAN